MGSYGLKQGNPLSNFEKLLRMKAETFSLIRVNVVANGVDMASNRVIPCQKFQRI